MMAGIIRGHNVDEGDVVLADVRHAWKVHHCRSVNCTVSQFDRCPRRLLQSHFFTAFVRRLNQLLYLDTV